MRSPITRAATAAACAALLALGAAPALGQQRPTQRAQQEQDSARTTRAQQQDDARAAAGGGSPGAQDGGRDDHLPAARENIEVVGRLSPTAAFGDVKPGQIADLAVHKGFAYLNSWDDDECRRGGTHVVDMRDPANPRETGFIAAQQPYYHGEGAHALSIATPAFTGDLLAVNNETYGSNVTAECSAELDTSRGGFDLYDVSNPATPTPLTLAAGDKDPDNDPATAEEAAGNSYHSVFVWQAGERAYLVASDNIEFTDVDVFDITNPRNPELIGDWDLVEMFPEILDDENGNGSLVFNHDMVVKTIGGRQIMLASYWDAGYVQLDVTDPRNPTRRTDTTFAGEDPLIGNGFSPEGNAHYGEFSFDNQFVLAADEDFGPFRLRRVELTTGPDAGDYPASGVGGSASTQILAGGTMNGPTYYGGYGCPDSDPIPSRSSINPVLGAGEEAIIVLQRGPVDDPENPEEACFPGQKAEAAINAGWDAVLLVDRHQGESDADGPPFCGSGGFPADPIVAVCTTHHAFHLLFGSTPDYSLPYDSTREPEIGESGEKISADDEFDGWGYAHLYDAATSERIDSYAIQEALDPRYAADFGDLSIHEWATDPETNLAYSAYYAGGFRVAQFGREFGIRETGRFIDEGGSNFWGVEQFTDAAGNRLIAVSDRDYGLNILKYTGPGAVLARPAPEATTSPPAATTPPATTTPPAATTPPATTTTVPSPAVRVATPSSFFAFGDLRRVSVRAGRARLTIRVPGAGRATGRLKARIGRTMRTLGVASATARRAGSLTFTFRISRTAERALRRTVERRTTRRTSGVLGVSFTRTGGVERTRNRAVSVRAPR